MVLDKDIELIALNFAESVDKLFSVLESENGVKLLENELISFIESTSKSRVTTIELENKFRKALKRGV